VPPTRGDSRQRGFVDILPEEAPLPSEAILSGGVLVTRLREANAALRAALFDGRPEDIDPEHWRVVCAHLAAPAAALPRAPGTPAKMLSQTQRARDCFPGLSVPAAVRRYREALDAPAVRKFIADFRALEAADILEQRGLVREALRATIDRGASALYLIDPSAAPNEFARVSACVTAACKVLVDMDALAARPEDNAITTTATDPDDDGTGGAAPAALLARVAVVAEDMKRRRAPAAG
jgi:hypothetical protein